MTYEYLKYYDIESYLFEIVGPRFRSQGCLDAFDLFTIIIWKANRAKSKIARVFVMFTKTFAVVWCYSGNELRRIYLEDPGNYISGPLELPIPTDLDERLTAMYENF